MSDTAPKPRLSANAKLILGIIVVIFWTAAASDWESKGCTMTLGYGYAIQHGGWPDEHEGCEDKYDDPHYTDEYRR
jgi:hypothetical protein